ncbi:solute carrier family 2, facilitated glucose transporter member 11-like [Polyodon spathula]|nr:solute carrier family 2, facilitated glucose transporter member 11-like [Polyodon spathula]
MTHAMSDLCHSPMLVLAIFVVGIGGTFQYGFQISVLNSPSPYIKRFLNETWLMRYGAALEDWKLNLIWSFIISLYAVGGLIGALNAGHLAVKYGRKRCLLSNNFVAIAGGVMMGLSRRAQSFEMIMVGRFLYGINAGISLNVQTMYLGESAPKRLRGLVSMTVSTFLSIGKLSGQLLGLNEILGSEDLWPVLLAFSVIPALIQLVSLPFFPETPRYLLIDKGDQAQCEKALQQLWGKGDYRSEIHDMVLEHAAIKGEKSKSVLELILDRSLRWQLLTVFVTFTTLQLCGINAIYLYSFDVFRAAGIPVHQVRYVALGTGLCEIFTSLFCGLLIESTGRRVLLLRGYWCMALVLGLLTVTIFLQDQIIWMSYCSMALIFAFIFFFGSGPAGVTAPLPGEMFNQAFRPAAFVIGGSLNWVGLFIIGMIVPILVDNLDYLCFIIFLGFCFFSGVYVWFYFPETKGKTVLEITEDFQKMHLKTKTEVAEIVENHKELQSVTSTKF